MLKSKYPLVAAGPLLPDEVADARPLNHRALVEFSARVLEASGGAEFSDTYYDAQRLRSRLYAAIRESPDHDRDLTHLVYSAYQWGKFAMPTFRLTHSLAAALALTDCKGIKVGDLKLPFSSIVVGLPSTFRATGVEGTSQVASMVQFNTIRAFRTDLGNPIALKLQSIADEIELHSRAGSVSAVKALDREFDELYAKADRENQIPYLGLCRVFFENMATTLILRTSWEADEPLEKWIESPFTVKNDAGLTQVMTEEQHLQSTCLRILANLLLYISEKGGLQKQGHRDYVGGVPADVSRAGFPRTWLLGREVKLDRQTREAAQVFANRRHLPREWRATRRFTVRGHWRNQAHGPGRRDHRRVWIAPFWKGPKDVRAAFVRLYSVGVNGGGQSGKGSASSQGP